MPTAIDYDTRRQDPDAPESLEEHQARQAATNPAVVDVDDSELAQSYAPHGADLFEDEEFVMPVTPIQADEFRCTRCFLAHHQGMRAEPGRDVCRECT